MGASIRIFELMDRESEVKDGDQILEQFGRGTCTHVVGLCWLRRILQKVQVLHSSIAGITFHNVCFNYPSRPDEPVLKVSIEDMM